MVIVCMHPNVFAVVPLRPDFAIKKTSLEQRLTLPRTRISVLAWHAALSQSYAYAEAVTAEGWYVDPYGAHERRWFSDGTPTSLVCDQGATSRDEPPDYPPPVPLVEIVPVDSGADDLIRADELERVDSDPQPRARIGGSIGE
jgi:hypothetical protein